MTSPNNINMGDRDMKIRAVHFSQNFEGSNKLNQTARQQDNIGNGEIMSLRRNYSKNNRKDVR